MGNVSWLTRKRSIPRMETPGNLAGMELLYVMREIFDN